MTALNLGDATRVLTPPDTAFSTVPFGDVNFVPLADPHAVVPVGDLYAIPRSTGDDVSTLQTDSTIAPDADWALFFAVANASAASGWPLFVLGDVTTGFVNLNANQINVCNLAGQVLVAGPPAAITPLTDDITVIAVSGSSTETLLAIHGQGVILSGGTADAVSPSPLILPTSGSAGDLLGVWQFEGETIDSTTLIDTMAAIYASLTGPAEPPSGNAHVLTQAQGLPANYDDLDEDLDLPPDLEAGGEQEPPEPPPFVVPSGVPDCVIRRHSEKYLDPVYDGFPEDWTPYEVIDEPYARMQITSNGTDVTWVNGVPTLLVGYSRVRPFGSYAAEIEFPGLTVFHQRPAWLKNGANVSVVLHKINGGTLPRFTGAITKISRREDDHQLVATCTGIMFLSDLQFRLPQFTSKPRDVGKQLASVLNSAVSKRYKNVASVTTGSMTSVRGGYEPMLSSYVVNQLATTIAKDGRQYTIDCLDKQPVIRKKDLTTVKWTIHAGQPGIDVDLHDDATQTPNRIFGKGINTNGGRWRGVKYPFFHGDKTPAYPFTNPDKTIRVGTRDTDTDTGNGVSTWQRKVGLKVTGYYSSANAAECRRLQRQMGIAVDGIVGPQTWAATFRTGTNIGSLEPRLLPLAWAKEVMPRLYGPRGEDLGPNPAYDPNVLVVDRYINFGQDVSFTQGRKNAEAILKRDAGPGWIGTITFNADPREGSKHEINEGDNIRVIWENGESVIVQVSAVDASPEDDGSPVTCEVDSKARDYPTLDAILGRERDAVDPARTAYRALKSSSINEDTAIFDAESPAGRIDRMPLFGGLWTVRQTALGDWGTITRMWFRTTSVKTEFAVGIFGRPITPAQLQNRMGNPLSTGPEDDPWAVHGEWLENFYIIDGMGWREQPMGYYPRTKTNPKGNSGAPITGRYEYKGSIPWGTKQSPWVWVAMIAKESCYIEGRIYSDVAEDF